MGTGATAGLPRDACPSWGASSYGVEPPPTSRAPRAIPLSPQRGPSQGPRASQQQQQHHHERRCHDATETLARRPARRRNRALRVLGTAEILPRPCVRSALVLESSRQKGLARSKELPGNFPGVSRSGSWVPSPSGAAHSVLYPGPARAHPEHARNRCRRLALTRRRHRDSPKERSMTTPMEDGSPSAGALSGAMSGASARLVRILRCLVAAATWARTFVVPVRVPPHTS